MSKKYTTADIAAALSVSDRTARRKLAEHVTILNGRYELSEAIFKYIAGIEDTSSDTVQTSADTESQELEYDIIEGFSTEEYQEFQKRLVEYPLLKDHLAAIMNELEYHRKSGESKDRQMELILANIQQRNFIEAKDKKID